MNPTFLVLRRFFALFLIPYIEMVALRFLISKEAVYQYLLVPFGPGKIFYAVIPFAISLVVFLVLLEKRGEPLQIALQKTPLFVNILSLPIFLIISFNLGALAPVLGRERLTILWYGAGSVAILSSLLVTWNLRIFIERIKHFPFELSFSLFSGGLFWLFHVSVEYFWSHLSAIVTLIIYAFLRALGLNMMYGENSYTLRHPLFSASIGAACSGLEGIFLFLFLFSLVLVIDWNSYSGKGALGIYLAGIAYMFFLNILRVGVFFVAAIWATQRWGKSVASDLFVWFFHANVGWVFYLIGITLFFAVLFRFNIGHKNLPQKN